jgi:hypothetical protein
MPLSEEKASHLSHVILASLKAATAARLKGNDEHCLREIKRLLAAELAEEERMDDLIRKKVASYSRPPVEGSPQWDVLYRKLMEEELRRRNKR